MFVKTPALSLISLFFLSPVKWAVQHHTNESYDTPPYGRGGIG
jgi:hypothetical protein